MVVTKRAKHLTLVLMLCVPLFGCAVGGDVLNPDFINFLGFDPDTIVPPQGVLIFAFNNTTDVSAQFFAFYTEDVNDATVGSRNLAVFVEPGETGNEVVDCPVGVVGAGSLAADFSVTPLAASLFVVDAEGAVEQVDVEYGGPVLTVGESFACGDVIELRLSSTPVGDETEFFVNLRLIKGR